MTNTNINIFEYASKNKFRYPYKGMITTEDLWDMTPAQLDIVYKALNKDAADAQIDSLMCTMDHTDAELLMKIDIVKHIFKVKENEVQARKDAASKSAKKQRILDILAQREENDLQAMSKEDLLKMLNDLD